MLFAAQFAAEPAVSRCPALCPINGGLCPLSSGALGAPHPFSGEGATTRSSADSHVLFPAATSVFHLSKQQQQQQQ